MSGHPGFAIVHADTVERFRRTMGQSGGAAAYSLESLRVARQRLKDYETENQTEGEYVLVDLEDYTIV